MRKAMILIATGICLLLSVTATASGFMSMVISLELPTFIVGKGNNQQEPIVTVPTESTLQTTEEIAGGKFEVDPENSKIAQDEMTAFSESFIKEPAISTEEIKGDNPSETETIESKEALTLAPNQ